MDINGSPCRRAKFTSMYDDGRTDGRPGEGFAVSGKRSVYFVSRSFAVGDGVDYVIACRWAGVRIGNM